jgi:hypothetical protein
MRIILILQVVLIGLMASVSQTLASEPIPRTVTFSIYREGQNIGQHSLSFERQGSAQIVTVNVDISIQKLGVVAYRFKHQAREVWKDGQLENLKTSTDDNGKLYAVEGHHTERGIEVERTAPGEMSAAEAANGGIALPLVERETLPANTLPTSLWNVETVKRLTLLNTQYGTLSKIQVVALGREAVSLKSGNREATHYHFTGDLRMDLWFDDDGRWVKATFLPPEGSTVDYVLDE